MNELHRGEFRRKSGNLYKYPSHPSTIFQGETAMQHATMKRMNNDMAVSPIVATLVLIVVAVIGAVAVGTIMGTFSTDVSKQANSQQASSASQTEITVAGSTSVQPAAEQIAKVYESSNPGVKITVQGGGSGAGVQAAALGLADIGSTSDLSKVTSAQSSYPNLKTYQIGGSGVVWIANSASGYVPTDGNITRSELIGLYNQTFTTLSGQTDMITSVYHRADSSGTEETAAKWVTASGSGLATQQTSFAYATDAKVKSATGNAGILAAVQSNKGALGFVDMGYAYDSNGNVKTGIKVLNVTEDTTYTPTAPTAGSAQVASKANILAEDKLVLNANGGSVASTYYPSGLAKGLWYITNGEPSAVVKNFITFSQSNGASDAMHAAGVFSNVDLSAF
jgi:phosphate transport system substrate-binding protein